MHRRTFLAVGGASLAAAIAGCTGDGDDGGGDDGDPTPTETETETPTDETPTETETETPEPTETDDPNGDGPAFGEAVDTTTSMAFSGEFTDSEEGIEGELEGRFHDGNSYMSYTFDSETFEMYFIDDTSYMVADGECIENPLPDMQPDDPGQDPDDWEGDVEEYGDRSPDGTTTVEGEEAYYWDIDEGDDQVTYYVSVSEGRLLRIEFPEGHIDYHSWGAVDPIEPPDMECMAPP
ncbi:MAG: hypothetical protein ACLFMX_00340 [Halobacteriales archaeon]